MLLDKRLLVVAMKKRTVSQAEYVLQLLIHEISHDDCCQIYIFCSTAVLIGMAQEGGLYPHPEFWLKPPPPPPPPPASYASGCVCVYLVTINNSCHYT